MPVAGRPSLSSTRKRNQTGTLALMGDESCSHTMRSPSRSWLTVADGAKSGSPASSPDRALLESAGKSISPTWVSEPGVMNDVSKNLVVAGGKGGQVDCKISFTGLARMQVPEALHIRHADQEEVHEMAMVGNQIIEHQLIG